MEDDDIDDYDLDDFDIDDYEFEGDEFGAAGIGAELVPIRVFMSESEASIAKGALDAFGIRCMISHDDAGGQDPFLRIVQGIRLLVRSDDAGRAEQVLSAPPI